MFTVIFAIGRRPGWIAHWGDMNRSPKTHVGRPLYIGPAERQFAPLTPRWGGLV